MNTNQTPPPEVLGSPSCCAALPTQRTDSDCFSACLSWLLRLTQDEVPDFTDREDPNSGKFYHNVADFLKARGLRMMMIEWRDMPAWIGGPVIARGTSPREKKSRNSLDMTAKSGRWRLRRTARRSRPAARMKW